MPKESINVYLTAIDGVSPVFASITDKTKALNKESQQLKQTYEALQKANAQLIQQKTALQKELQGVNEEVREARKGFQKLGDEASSDAYEKAQEKQQGLRNKIAATTKALQENQKMYKENIEAIRKNSMEEQGIDWGKTMKGLIGGRVGKELAASFGGAFQAGLSSAFGSDMGGAISETLSGALSGAAAGALFGLPGIAAGAVLGGVSGLISGGTKIFEAEDDAFKAYYGGLYEDVKGRSGEMVERGAALAGERETERVTAVVQALEQMKSSDAELRDHLNTLNGLGIDAVGMLAEAKSADEERMNEMISEGEISGAEAAEIISAALEKAYPGGMEDHTFEGLSSKLEGLEQALDQAGGDAYNSLRSEGKRDTIDAYGGELGESIKEINAIIGENQARKENMQDQYMREVLDMVLNGTKGELWNTFDDQQREDLTGMREDFEDTAKRYEDSGGMDGEAAARMEALYEAAQAMGEAYYDNSEFAQMLNETELDEIEMIRENTVGLETATKAAYELQQELSKGVIATIKISYGSSGGTWDVDPDAPGPEDGPGWYDDGWNFHPITI